MKQRRISFICLDFKNYGIWLNMGEYLRAFFLFFIFEAWGRVFNQNEAKTLGQPVRVDELSNLSLALK